MLQPENSDKTKIYFLWYQIFTPPYTAKSGESKAAALDDELSATVFCGYKLSMQLTTQILRLT